MSDNLPHSRLLGDLPFDVLLNIFDECDVVGILNLSVTCKRVNEASGNRQTWLNKVRQLKIPVPTDTFPPAAELKEWAVSWSRSDERWVKPRAPDDEDRSLYVHRFDMRQVDDDDEEARVVPFVMANLIPGGKFVVILYIDGQIDLKEIDTEFEDEWELRDVAKYIQGGPGGTYTTFWSELLTETNLGRPPAAYVDREKKNLLVFLVDHVAGIIEWKQTVKLDDIHFREIWSIHARGNTILCFYECGHGWGITVSELGSDPAMKHFTISNNERPDGWALIHFSIVSENAVVFCDPEGIHLYHIPDLSSTQGSSTLSPVWEWLRKSWWFFGSVCMTFSRQPMLSLQTISETHTITFRMDASGRNPVVSEHRVSGELPAPLPSLAGGSEFRFAMKGQKLLCYGSCMEYVYRFDTCLLGRKELAGGFNIEAYDVDDDWEEHYLIFPLDFDEKTARILISGQQYRCKPQERHEATFICLADLPPL